MTSPPKAGVLVLPGGMPRSDAPTHLWQLAHVRMALLTGSLRRRLGDDVEVRRVRYRVRGWNPDRLDALTDAKTALDRLAEFVGSGPIVLVGHSMGGRVAAHLAARDDVAAVAALAPWWPEDDADLIPPGRRLITMHGSADTWTDPVATHTQTVRAAARGVDARWVEFPRAGHYLLRDYGRWHRLTADFAVAQFEGRSPA